MIKIKTLLGFFVKLGLVCGLLGVLTLTAAYFYLKPGLPDVQQLRNVQLQTPMRVYSSDKLLIAEYGEKRRTPVSFDQVPESFVNAVLAAEDSRFYEHFGVDIKGLARAAFELASTGRIKTGGSTITMQVARNYFLTRKKTFTRKFNEILLAIQIERELSKEEILELYLNKIYLGNRAYGIQAAANAYYGRNIDQLTLAELAMIAGLPKAPSAYNPIANPSRAKTRRDWILSRMNTLNYISNEAYQEAKAAPITARYHGTDIELYAPYIAEMVRKEMFDLYGERIYTDGFNVYTTVRSIDQEAANTAVVDGLMAYEHRHGYRGPEKSPFVDDESLLNDHQILLKKLKKEPVFGVLMPAVVLNVTEADATVLMPSGEEISLALEQVKWARTFKSVNARGPVPKTVSEVLQPNQLIRIIPREDTWELAQVPVVQGAFVALSPNNGAVRALVGGFNFVHSKFNRATQAFRQPGSNFKPFVYTAALESGFTPASIINDAPVVFEDKNLESSWRPENYSKKFYGPTRLREALYKSRNLVSIRILRSLGVSNALSYLENLGFVRDRLPNNLSLALGSADVTPMELVTGYASFANQGFRITPYLIDEVVVEGEQLSKAQPLTVCEDCIYLAEGEEPSPEDIEAKKQFTPYPLATRVLDERSAYLMNNIMQDVIKRGTARKAKVLGRSDLAGKTGTTNDQKDAWFSGFNSEVVASAWVGFDQPETLGRREFGGTAALPIWISFMEKVLAGTPERQAKPPEGIVSVRIDPKTGLLAYPGQKDAVFEIFREESVPLQSAKSESVVEEQVMTDELF